MPLHDDDHDLDAFRARCRAWLAAHAPSRAEAPRYLADPDRRWSEGRRFQRTQYEAGLGGITWPEAYGGQGLTMAHQRAFNEEAGPYYLPSSVFQITLSILGMTLLDHGTEEQKRRHIPEMLRGEALWVQLLSEPAAGSDLAALLTRATRDGDEWVLSGEKVWSTDADRSDYAMVLARTDWDVPKHAGLTMFIVPFDAPGMTVLPLRQISGDEEFCQEFLDDVRVPADAVLGGLGNGWAVASSLFNHSRTMTSGGGLAGPTFATRRGGDPDPARDLIDRAVALGVDDDPRIRALVAEAVIDNTVSGLLSARTVTAMRTGAMNPAGGSLAKLFGVVTLQRRGQIDLEVLGLDAVGWRPGSPDGSYLHGYLNGRTASVAGGTDEILRNTIGERLLGLPKEPTVDRDLAFGELQRRATDRRP